MTNFPEPYFRGGAGAPLVLLHGVTSTWQSWNELLPILTGEFEVLAPTLAGHRGGPPLRRPVKIADFADSVEAAMDQAGFETAHIAGHSLGGWVAFELARRGRAVTVAAISPAGGWSDQPAVNRAYRMFAKAFWATKVGGPVGLMMMKFAAVRKIAMSDFSARPESLSPEAARELCVGLTAFELKALREIGDERLCGYSEITVPSQLVWADRDRLFPKESYGAVWRQASPNSEWRVIEGAGHNVHLDQPDAMAQVIAEFARR